MTTQRTRRDVSRRPVLLAGGGAAAFGLAGCFGDDPENGEEDGIGGENGGNDEEAGATGPENAEYYGDRVDASSLGLRPTGCWRADGSHRS